jgi:cytochrome c553
MRDRPTVAAGWTVAASATVAAAMALLPGATCAQATDDLSLRSLAATCAACHGTAGHAVPGSAIPALAGMSREAFVADMRGFRDGTRPATIMQQLAKGFDEKQITALAAYFTAPGPEPAQRPANTAR